MHRRLALTLSAVCLLGGAAPQATAADAVPAPDVHVSVKAGGVSLPKSTTTASWVVGTPGIVANFNVKATNVQGAVTTIDALWTSRDFKVYDDNILTVEYTLDGMHKGLPDGTPQTGWIVSTRYRQAGGRWSGWQSDAFDYSAAVTEIKTSGNRFNAHWNRKKLVQYQVNIHISMADAGNQEDYWTVRANP
jgi:hypothetical protein